MAIYRFIPTDIGLRKTLHFSDESGNQLCELCKPMIVEQLNVGSVVMMVWVPLRLVRQCRGGMCHLSLSVSHEYQGYDVVTRVEKYGAV